MSETPAESPLQGAESDGDQLAQAEARLRWALHDVRKLLGERRGEKRELAKTIKELVAAEVLLSRAVAVFDRAAGREPEQPEPEVADE